MGEFLESDKKDSNLSMDILRQRRNLMLISVLMPLFFLSGASIDKISLLGTEIIVKNSGYIDIFIFILFFYFWWRYWQYFKADNTVSKCKNEIEEEKLNLELELFKPWTEKAVKKYFNENFNKISVYFDEIDKIQTRKISKDNGYALFRKRVVLFSVSSKVNKLTFTKEAKNFIKAYDARGGNEIDMSEEFPIQSMVFKIKVEYLIAKLLYKRFNWWISFIVSKRYYSDYILPIVIAYAFALVTIAPYLFKFLT